MKNLLHASIITCCLIVINTIEMTATANDQLRFKTTNPKPHNLKVNPTFPFKQIKSDNVLEGKVRFYGFANNTFANKYLVDPEPVPATIEWIVEHYDRMQVYAPWFNDTRIWIAPKEWEHIDHTEWYSNGLEYKDLYAIYDCAQEVNYVSCNGDNHEHQEMYDLAMQAEADPDIPDWIMKDSNGNRLYIRHECDSETGECPQLAADISNPAFRKLWIEQMINALQGGNYRGLFIDDVNLDVNRSLSDGNGCLLINNSCGWTVNISANQWAESLVDFVEEIRSAIPEKEIVHNSVWFHALPGDPFLERQVDAADTIVFERGINDLNITLANIDVFFAANDYVHSRGRNMIHIVYRNELVCSSDPCFLPPLTLQSKLIQFEYGLAGWLLASEGHDWFGTFELNTPDDWWHGFDTNLGKALGDRYVHPNNGLYIREFKRGVVLLNAPGEDATPVTINLSPTFYTLNGEPVNQITLPTRTGKILFRKPPKINFTGPQVIQSN